VNVADWIDRHAAFTPDKPAIRFSGSEISYRALAGQVALLAGMLHGRCGVRQGDRVAFIGYNRPEMLVLLLACTRVGAIFLPLNWRLAAPEHVFVVNDCTPVAFFASGEFVDRIDGSRDEIGDMHLVALDGGHEGWSDYAGLLESATPMEGAATTAGYDAAALICYTSGTTGRPKGAVLDQNALLFSAVNSTHMHDLTAADRVLSTLPMFHVGGLNIQTLPALHAGATVTLHVSFDPQATLDTIVAEQITLTVLVPAQLVAMMNLPEWQSADLSSLRMITTGSTLVSRALIDAVHARGIPLIQVYGSTETAPIATYLTRHDARRKAGSGGLPGLHCEMRIVDDGGADVAPGTSGEILIRGPNVMRGYWKQPETTADCLRDGWFHSGDVGHIDGDGYLFVDDRMKDMIISGGENIYPAELENVLAGHADLAEAAVVGRRDAQWGEVPVAVVVARDGCTVDTASVTGLFDGRLARFKHPREVLFVDRLPRNAMGKVQKHQIREMVARQAAER